jgi:hypothetical protein
MVFLRRMSKVPRKKKGSFIPFPSEVAVAKFQSGTTAPSCGSTA